MLLDIILQYGGGAKFIIRKPMFQSRFVRGKRNLCLAFRLKIITRALNMKFSLEVDDKLSAVIYDNFYVA